MKNTIIIIGMGELGSVFARGFLKLGYPVQATTREMDSAQVAQEHPNPEAVLIAVGEKDLPKMLKSLPTEWKNNLILIQNELLPRDWNAIDIQQPTVISVWFEKKKGMDSKVVLPSPVYGPHAKLVFNALAQVDLPSYQLDSQAELTYELVRKNLYILTTNIAGLEVGGDVAQLRDQHAELMHTVAAEVLDIQDWLTHTKNNRERLLAGLNEAIEGDLTHRCMGRSAPARLQRALEFAHKANLKTPKLTALAQKNGLIT